MKSIYLVLLSALILVIHSPVKGQECSKFYPFSEGTEFELTSYDQKDKVQAKMVYKIMGVTTNGDNQVAKVAYDLYDEKGKPVEYPDEMEIDQTFNVHCKDNAVFVDMKSFMAGNQALQGMQGMEVSMDGTDLKIPNQLAAGDQLPDAKMTMAIQAGPMNMNMHMNFINRKVTGQEEITTPAGTYDAYVITYDTEMGMRNTRKGSGKQWIAENVGVVREESYDQKGNLIGYSQLTRFNQ